MSQEGTAMTDRDTREDLLRRALAMTAGADLADLEHVFADDVQVTTPTFTTHSRAELLAELAVRDSVMGELEVEIPVLGVEGDRAWAEWTVSAQLVGTLELDDDIVVEAVGQPIRLEGATSAEFGDGRITSLRQYWDEADLLDALGLLPTD
jgi:ketosteroid isomerase-like protein